jgi:hypothetical protein
LLIEFCFVSLFILQFLMTLAQSMSEIMSVDFDIFITLYLRYVLVNKVT